VPPLMMSTLTWSSWSLPCFSTIKSPYFLCNEETLFALVGCPVSSLQSCWSQWLKKKEFKIHGVQGNWNLQGRVPERGRSRNMETVKFLSMNLCCVGGSFQGWEKAKRSKWNNLLRSHKTGSGSCATSHGRNTA
jgi:hypothetical protein